MFEKTRVEDNAEEQLGNHGLMFPPPPPLFKIIQAHINHIIEIVIMIAFELF